MFFPYFIALILGLVNPSTQSNGNCHATTQVSTATNDSDPETDPGDGTDTGGETGQTPPPKIND